MFPGMILSRSSANVGLLSVCQALGQTQMILIFSVSSIIGATIAPNPAWATVPITFQFVFMTMSTVPAALLMKRIGRAWGFIVFLIIGSSGAALMIYALVDSNFFMFCAGSALFGSSAGANQQFRFAAVDAADKSFKSLAVSLVLAGGVFAGLAGPSLSSLGYDMIRPILYGGVFAIILILQAMMIVLLLFTDIQPPSEQERTGEMRPMREIAAQPAFIVAVLSAMIGYGVMNFVMLSTPIFMHLHPTHPFGQLEINNVIMWHILGMFAPGFVTGWLIKKFGDLNIILAGAVISVVCLVVNLNGDSIVHLRVGMALVGVGWNFMFTAGTTLLLTTYTPAEKAKVQGINDLFVFGTVAVCSLAAGVVYQTFGFIAVNLASAPLLVLVVLAVFWLRSRRGFVPA
ncbi:MAG: MFS transporter [Alphaproteobacteria bacterium]|nr:MFS transporter [Alphaproteobacteria bacterium]